MVHRVLPGILSLLVVLSFLPAQDDQLRLEAVSDFKTYWRKAHTMATFEPERWPPCRLTRPC